MNHTIIHMGEGKESWFRQAYEEYKKRMNSYGSLEEIPLKPAKTPGRELSSEEVVATLEREAAEFRKVLSLPKYQKSYKIALCIEGKQLSSEKFAALFEQVANNGKNSIVYLIGSSWGISEEIKSMCDLRLSFSPMTFPHSLFRVMLAEQIYRAAGIGSGSKYHK